jgi:ribonuclease E
LEAEREEGATHDLGSDESEGEDEGESEGESQGQQPAFGEGDGRRRRRRRGRRGRRGRREEGGAPPYQGPQASPIGHLPTPAQALEASDWPMTGGFDTLPGEAPPVPRDLGSPHFESVAAAPRRGKPEDERGDVLAPVREERASQAPATEEPKQERSTFASFFGFGTKPEDGSATPSEARPQRKGWWQRKADD